MAEGYDLDALRERCRGMAEFQARRAGRKAYPLNDDAMLATMFLMLDALMERKPAQRRSRKSKASNVHEAQA